MKSFTSALLASSLASQAVFGAPSQHVLNFGGMDLSQLSTTEPGFDLDLNARRLVQFAEDKEPVWITELEKIQAKANGRRFFDVTETPANLDGSVIQPLRSYEYPALNASEPVFNAISNLDINEPERNLKTFTSFRTRYYRSETGRQSQKWLYGRVSDITSEYALDGLRSRIDIHEFSHSWGQNSIIAKIKGTNPHGTIIISAHQDSTNLWPFLPAPGADDDGSGTVTILEAYRVLLATDFRPENDVEFHWYSAEEGGLLGSQAVAQAYKDKNATVLAQIQFDMTAYVKPGTKEEIGIITDYVDASLVQYVKELINQYLDIPWADSKCGYACSDHASWTKFGYPSAFGIESKFENSNHNIHSTGDLITVDGFSFTHLMEFAKLALGFAIELGSYNPKQ